MASLWHAVAGFGVFRPWLGLAEASGWQEALLLAGPFTLLAPLDLAGPPPGPLSGEEAWSLVATHVLPGRLPLAELSRLAHVRSMAEVLHPVAYDGRAHVAGALVIQGDLACDNGLVHVVDRWLPAPA